MKIIDSLKRQADIACCALRGFYEGLPNGYIINEGLYPALTKRLAAHLRVDPYVMYQSAAFYEGRIATRATCEDLCYIAVANKDDLKKEVIPFRSMELHAPEKALIRFLKIEYSQDREYARVKAQCLVGRHALCVLESSAPLYEVTRWMQSIGYNDKLEDPYCAPVPSLGLPGLYACVEIHPHPDSSIRNVKLIVGKDSDVNKENREIIRHRAGEEWCPKKRDEQVAEIPGYCALYCPSGWDECPYSGHSLTYQIGDCSECGATHVAMHPLYIERCVRCQREREGYTEID